MSRTSSAGRAGRAKTMEPLWTPSELLHKLLSDYLSEKINTETFCKDIIAAYNDAVDERALTDREQRIFEQLFDQAAWHCPFPKEQWEYPSYRTDTHVKEAAERARALLS